MKIRQATLNDVAAISAIHASSWRSTYKGVVPQLYLDQLKDNFWVESFQTWITNNSLTVQMICDEKVPVGCVAYGKSRDNTLLDWGEIVSIYLLPEYVNKGYGQKLLDVALSDMKKSGYHSIYLWVLKENLKAQKFYKKNKFEQTDDECLCTIQGKQFVDIRYIYKIEKNAL